MWTLIRIFPIMFGAKLKYNKLYLHFCLLVEIFRDLNDFSLKETKLQKIQKNIEKYLSNWKLFYDCESNTERFSIIPKQHFMIHYPNAIREFGPPSTYSTMRFESKHSYFKRLSNEIHNKRNITYSLSKRHQMLQLFFLNSPNLSNDVEFGPIKSRIDDVRFFSIFNLTIDKRERLHLFQACYVQFYSIRNKRYNML